MGVTEKGRRYVLTADASQLKKAFSEANRAMQDSMKNVRTLAKSLRFDSNNIDALKGQFTNFNQAVYASTKRVAALERQVKSLEKHRQIAFSTGNKESMKAYQDMGGDKALQQLKARLIDAKTETARLRQEMTKTDAAIKNNSFNKAFKEVNSELNEATSNARKFANAMKIDKTSMSGLNNQLKEIGNASDHARARVRLLEGQLQKLNMLKKQASSGSFNASKDFETLGGEKEVRRLKAALVEANAELKSFGNEAKNLRSTMSNLNFDNKINKLNQEIKEATTNMRNLNNVGSEIKSLSGMKLEFAEVGKAIDSTKQKIKAYESEISKLERLQAKLASGSASAAKAFELKGGEEQLRRLRTELEKTRNELTEFKQQASTLNSSIGNFKFDEELRKANQEIEEATANVKQLSAAMNSKGFNIGDASLRFKEMQRVIEQTEQKIRTLNAMRVDVKVNSGEFIKLTNEINKAEAEVKELMASMTALERFQMGGMRGLTGGVENFTNGIQNASRFARQKGMEMTMSLTAPGAYMASSLTRGYMETEKYIKRAAGAASGGGEAFQKNYEQIKGLTREISGMAPTFDYGQISKGIEQVIKGGVELENFFGENSAMSKKGVSSILQLASLEEMDTGVAAEAVISTLGQFNLGFDQATHVVDTLKAASDASTVSVGDLMETFKYAGPIAGTFGANLEDTALAATFVAKNGIKGSMAGTALRSMFSALTENATETHGALSKYGVSVLDSAGKTRPFKDIMRDLSKAMEGMTQAEKLAAAEALVGKNALSGVASILGITEDEFRKYEKAVYDSKGATEKMYQKMLEGADGRIQKGVTGIKNSFIELGEQIAPAVADVVETVEKMVNWFKGLPPEVKSAAVKIGAGVLALGPALTLFGWATAPIKGFFKAFKFGSQVLKGLKMGKNIKDLFDVGKAAKDAGDKMDNTGKTFERSSGRMKKSTGGLGKTIGDSFRGIGQGIGQTFRGIFDGISRVITAGSRGLSTIIKGVGTGLKSVFEGIGNGAKSALQGLGDAFKGAGQGISSAAKGIGQGIKSALEGVGTVIESIGKSIGFAARGIGEGLRAMFMGVAMVNPATMLAFAAAILAVGAAIALVLTQSDGIVAIIDQLGKTAALMIDTMANAFIRATPSIIALINAIRDAIVQVVPVITDAITQIIGKITEAIPVIANAIATVVSSIAGGISQVLGAIGGVIGQISGLVDSIAGVITAAGGAIKAALEGVGSAFTGFGNGVRLALEGVADVVDSVGNSIEKGLNGISKVIDSVGEAIKGALEGAADVIRSVGESAEKAGNGFRLFSEGMKQLSDIGAWDIGTTLASVATGLGKINAEKDNISSVAENVNKLKASFEGIGGGASAFASAISGISGQLSTFKSDIEAIPTALQNAATGFTTFSSNATQLASNLSQVSSQVQQFTQGVVQALAGLTAGTASITAFNMAIMTLGTGMMTAGMGVTMFGTSMTMLSASLTMASGAVTMFSAGFTAMTTAMTASSATVTMLVASITQLTSSLTSVSASTMSVTASMTSLIASFTALSATTIASSAGFAMFTGSLAMLSGSVTMASASITMLSGSMTMLSGTLAMASGSLAMFSGSFAMVTGALSMANGSVSMLSGSLSGLVGQLNGVSASASSVSASVSGMAATVASSFASISASGASAFASLVASAASGMAGMTAAVSAGTSAIIAIMQNFANQMQQLGQQAGQRAVQSTAQSIQAGSGQVSSAGMSVLNSARGAMMSVSFFSVGSSITQGIAAGINSGWGYLRGLVASMASSLLAAAKAALNINSPSREFRDDVGHWIPHGIAVGVNRAKEVAIRSVRNMAKATLSAAKGVNVAGQISDTFSSTLATNTRVEHSVRQNSIMVDAINTLTDRINNIELKSDVILSGQKVGEITYREHQNIERRLAY